MRLGWGLAATFIALASCGPAPAPKAPSAPTNASVSPEAHVATRGERKVAAASLYLRPDYDVAADPVADLKLAANRASPQHRHILVEVGGAWCIWCHVLDDFIADHDDVRDAMRASFVVLKVNYSEDNRNEAFLGRFPAIGGYPHFLILAADGSLERSQDTSGFEIHPSPIKTYDQDRLIAFAKSWSSKRGCEAELVEGWAAGSVDAGQATGVGRKEIHRTPQTPNSSATMGL